MKHRFIFVCLLSAAALPSLLATPIHTKPVPPPFSLSANESEPTSRTPPVTGIRLGKLHLQFERTPLSEIRRLANVGKVEHRGDAGESTSWLCYTLNGHPKPQRVWFTAGELDGPQNFISGIQALVLQSGEVATEGCPYLPKSLQPIALSNGIWLGKSMRDLHNALGKESTSKLGELTYFYGTKLPGTYRGKPVFFDRLGYLFFAVRDDLVQGLVASQTTTY